MLRLQLFGWTCVIHQVTFGSGHIIMRSSSTNCEFVKRKELGIYCIVKDVTVLDGEWDSYHLDDMLASQYQSNDWTQHSTNQSSICWGNLLAPGTMHEISSHEPASTKQLSRSRLVSCEVFLYMGPGAQRFPQQILLWLVVYWVQSLDWYCEASTSSKWYPSH